MAFGNREVFEEFKFIPTVLTISYRRRRGAVHFERVPWRGCEGGSNIDRWPRANV